MSNEKDENTNPFDQDKNDPSSLSSENQENPFGLNRLEDDQSKDDNHDSTDNEITFDSMEEDTQSGSKTWPGVMAVFAFLLTIAALTGLYFIWQQQQDINRQQKNIEREQRSLQSIQDDLQRRQRLITDSLDIALADAKQAVNNQERTEQEIEQSIANRLKNSQQDREKEREKLQQTVAEQLAASAQERQKLEQNLQSLLAANDQKRQQLAELLEGKINNSKQQVLTQLETNQQQLDQRFKASQEASQAFKLEVDNQLLSRDQARTDLETNINGRFIESDQKRDTLAESLAGRIQSGQQETNQLKQNQQNLLAEYEEIKKAHLNREREFVRIQNDISRQLEVTQTKLQQLSTRGRSEWLLAEAEYLVRLAARRLLLEHDTKTAVALLQAADQRVEEVDDASLITIRRAIAEDITAIKATSVVDTQGIVLKLDAMISQIPTLQLISLEVPDGNKSEDIAPSLDQPPEEVSAWRKHLDTVLKEIKDDWVVIRRHEYDVKPLIGAEQHSNLVENIQLSLQQASIAATRYEQEIYYTKLSQVKDWITNFFRMNEGEIQAIVGELDNLMQVKVSPDFPQQLASQQIIKQENQHRLEQWLQQEQ